MRYRDAIGDGWSVKILRSGVVIADEHVTIEKGYGGWSEARAEASDQGGWDASVCDRFEITTTIHEADVALSVPID